MKQRQRRIQKSISPQSNIQKQGRIGLAFDIEVTPSLTPPAAERKLPKWDDRVCMK